MARTYEHAKETQSRNYVRSIIDGYYPNGDALIREWSERDYGIDFVLELFDNGTPTGKLAYLQIKGTGSPIEKLKKSNEVSCSNVSLSCLAYAGQDRIPFILIYASLSNPGCFYYIDLQKANITSSINPLKKKVTVRIPHANKVEQDSSGSCDLKGFFELVNSYYQP